MMFSLNVVKIYGGKLLKEENRKMGLEVEVNKEKYIFVIFISFGSNIFHKPSKFALDGREPGAK
jgi:hypothetical protein